MYGRYDFAEPFSPWADDEFFNQGVFEGTLSERVQAALDAPHPTSNQQRLVKLVEGMTPDQFEAATFDEQPLLVLAGAGTGKTRVLTVRIALLVTAGMAQPSEILALTFTNKAAKEMGTRLKRMLDLDAVAVTATTFHAFCARMLRDYGGEIGWQTDWTILDSDEMRKMMRNCWKDRFSSPPTKDELNDVEQAHDVMFCAGNSPEEAQKDLAEASAHTVWDYQARKARENVKDFSDLITEMAQMLERSPWVLKEIQRRFKYVLVDEYQDTDGRQEALLRKILGDNPNVTVVGDEDQLVYTWRHAKIENILNFGTRWNAHTVRLQLNFRSTQNILDAANRLIRYNKNRLGKELYTFEDDGPKVAHSEFESAYDEARWIVDRIEEDIAAGVPREEIAVLVRASHALNFVEQALNQKGIRYTLSGGKKFQDRVEIKDMCAHLRLIANAHDSMAFERAITSIKRNVGAGLLEDIAAAAKRMRTDITDAARRMALGGIIPQNARGPVLQFCRTIASVAADAVHGELADVILTKLLEDTGYTDAIKADLAEAKENGDNDAVDALSTRLTNLDDLLNIAKDKNLTEFLDHLGLSEDTRKDDGKGVWIGTIHAAKGLEFFNVYLPGWEQGVLPSKQAMKGDGDLEEERRLGYVAITRARKKLHISHSLQRFGQDAWASCFLADLGFVERPDTGEVAGLYDPDAVNPFDDLADVPF
ncbi:ATP-dependent helicase [Sphingosinicella sp. BN140058]|uniref:ATP-dependent helicase n=1 Tax=Sphingosinicella sp. BN140058 TaxID=1892855 RepID=UPI00101239C5|nr:ATP-dependent helicase [Sphingosinicella sp. BN140058]QAY80200.1 ATP-dependent helicase [Sphingosinicella sp. BN140058]